MHYIIFGGYKVTPWLLLLGCQDTEQCFLIRRETSSRSGGMLATTYKPL